MSSHMQSITYGMCMKWSIAGAVTGAITTPLDVIKTRLMIQVCLIDYSNPFISFKFCCMAFKSIWLGCILLVFPIMLVRYSIFSAIFAGIRKPVQRNSWLRSNYNQRGRSSCPHKGSLIALPNFVNIHTKLVPFTLPQSSGFNCNIYMLWKKEDRVQ